MDTKSIRPARLLVVAGAAALAWAALAATSHGVISEVRASTGPPCGAGELCIKQSQVPTTALAFNGGSGCGSLTSSDPSEDLWHFVIPNGAGFSTNTADFSAIFGSTTIHASSIGGPNNKMAYVYSPAGATLTWAFATNVNGTSTQGDFVLSGTCPASQSGSSSTTSGTTTSSSTTSTETGGVSGSSTTSDGSVAQSSSAGGVLGTISTPNTGAGSNPGAILGVVVLVTGLVSLAIGAGRRER